MQRLVFGALALAVAAAECPNACSGHGQCQNYDMCHCWRNWQGADCSERTCAFGLAHVDSPKGDLDSSGVLSKPNQVLIEHSTVYPYGTQEKYPNMSTTAGVVLDNTAHYYMECSNKGICDRKTGECECFDGYEGSSCQRASCPNQCSGHGTCEHIKTLAATEFGNVYDLWDAETTMGCLCDAGFSGPDCSVKDCKYGIDPLYIDDESTARVEAVDYRIFAGDHPGHKDVTGTYALKFYDAFGEDYETEPLKIGDDCVAVRNALEGLPNMVVPRDSVRCFERAEAGQNYDHFSLTFRGNPGYLKQLFVDTYLEGERSTVFAANEYVSTAFNPTVQVWNTGMTGEFNDYFATQCHGGYVQVKPRTGVVDGVDRADADSGYKMEPVGAANVGFKLLKECMGDSDGIVESNVEVYNWDYGTTTSPSMGGPGDFHTIGMFPHAVKLVQVDPFDEYVGGMHYLTWWHPTDQDFVLANFPSNHTLDPDNTFAVFTTDGVVEAVRVVVPDNSSSMADDDGPGIPPAFDDDGPGIPPAFDDDAPYMGPPMGDDDAPYMGPPMYDDMPMMMGMPSRTPSVEPTPAPSTSSAPTSSAPTLAPTMQGTPSSMPTEMPTDGVRRRLSHGNTTTPPSGQVDPMHDIEWSVRARFSAYSNVIYTSHDASCETGHSNIQPCLDKGDLLFLVNSRYQYSLMGDFTGSPDPLAPETGNLYEIKKIYKVDPTETTFDVEDRFRIELDKSLPFNGEFATDFGMNSMLSSGMMGVTSNQRVPQVGYVRMFKFSPATTGNYDFVSQCSGRGACEEGTCDCFLGYTNDNCDTQAGIAV